MAESTAAEQSTSPRTSEFVAFNAPHLGVRRASGSRLWVIDPGPTEERRQRGIFLRALAPWLATLVVLPASVGLLYALYSRVMSLHAQATAELPHFYEEGFADGFQRQAMATATIWGVLFAALALVIYLPSLIAKGAGALGPRALPLPRGFCGRLESIAWFRAVERDDLVAAHIHRQLWKVARIEQARTRAGVDLGSPTGRRVIAIWDEVADDLARLRTTYWHQEPVTVQEDREETDAADPRTLELLTLIAAAHTPGRQNPGPQHEASEDRGAR